MSFRRIRSYGKRSVEIIGNNKLEFLSDSEIVIPRRLIPKNLDKNSIPGYERLDARHYRISQYCYFEDRVEELAYMSGKPISDMQITPELSLQWEREFRYCYFIQFKNKVRLVKQESSLKLPSRV